MQKYIKKHAQWRRLRASAVLLLCVGAIPPVWPATAADNEATLNFVGADIEAVIKAVGHYTNTTFIIDPRVKGTINLVAEKALTKAQAFGLLASALRLQGYAMVAGDGFTKVVPEADAKLQASPTQVRGGAVRLKGDQIGTRIFRLNYESAGNMVAVLRPLISPNNTINANPGNNSLVITDYADNLNRLGKIIAALDSGAAAPGTTGGQFNLIADSRTNAVIVRAPSLARANLAKSLIAKLDQPTAQPGNVHVVYLKNADATKLALTLRSVVGSDGTAPGSTPTQYAAPVQNTANGTTGMAGAMPPSATPATLSAGGAAGFIQADTATNALIITAAEPIYRNLRTVIDQLDVRRAQVYIESLIVEVTADKAAEFGIQWLGLSGDGTSNYRVGGGTSFSTGGDNIISQAVARSTPPGIPLPPGGGLTLGVFRQINGALGLGALARALESDANTNILSTPNLITLDNEEAKIIVGQNVPFITGQYTTQASGGGAGVNPFQTIERKDVGLSLRVRPQISEGGTVKMAIYQETSAVQSTANAAGIITSKRSIETNVLADDGQIIVLGGLIEDTVGDGAEKVPLLGDIPIIGNLFKYQKRSRKKTNLMVFLRPTVIRSSEQSARMAADRYDYIRGTEIAAQPAKNFFLPDTGAPVLPPLQGGRPIGGTFLGPIPAVPVPAIGPGSENLH